MYKVDSWGTSALRDFWNSLFTDDLHKEHVDDIESQCVLLLVEVTCSKMKQIVRNYSDLKAEHGKTLEKLNEMGRECESLRKDANRILNCPKCPVIEKELIDVKKAACETNRQMDSIAKILRLGNHFEHTEGNKMDAAVNLLSQMLLSKPNDNNSFKFAKPDVLAVETDVLMTETGVEIVPGTVGVVKSPSAKVPGNLLLQKNMKSPVPFSSTKSPRSSSANLPLLNIPQKCATKKNLSANFALLKRDRTPDESPEKLKFNLIQLPQLNEPLHDKNPELDEIWFKEESKQDPNSDGEATVINGTPTPQNEKKKKKTDWVLKPKVGLSDTETTSSGNRLKQLKLSIKSKPEKVTHDISKLVGFNGGTLKDDLIPNNPVLDDANTTLFNPIACSTQKQQVLNSSFDRVPGRDEESPPPFVFKRDAVRKKAERAKLEGWDCEECEKYYKSLGKNVADSDVKKRMNACSRHRDRFKPVRNATPPGFWDPNFPDTEECRERGMYESIYCPRKKS